MKGFRNRRKTVTDPVSGREFNRHTCAECKTQQPLHHFEGLPFIHKCNTCMKLSDKERAELRDRQGDEAMRRLAQVVDSVETKQSLEPVERGLLSLYGAWGGSEAFYTDLSRNIKKLAETPAKLAQAVAAQLNVIRLHSKVDKLKQDDEFRQMDDARLSEAIKMRAMGVFAELATTEAKAQALAILMGQDVPTIEGRATDASE